MRKAATEQTQISDRGWQESHEWLTCSLAQALELAAKLHRRQGAIYAAGVELLLLDISWNVLGSSPILDFHPQEDLSS